MKYWVNILHIYQPPVQDEYWVRRIAQECYIPLFRVLSENPDVHVTLNISGVLLLHFSRLQMSEMFELIDRTKAAGNVEFTGSAAYHPIMPMLTAEECIRQIESNERIMQDTAGIHSIAGFFLPEMCYSRAVADVIAHKGYRWVVLDEIGRRDTCSAAQITGTPLYAIFRSRGLSNALNTYAVHVDDIFKARDAESPVWITATDGEIYGHHKKNFWQIFNEIKNAGIKTQTVSEFLNQRKVGNAVDVRACSWASTEEELRDGIPYGRWYNRYNELHQIQWAITAIARKRVNASGNEEPREMLDRALFSCQYYWANPGILWYPGMIMKGLELWEKIFTMCGGIREFKSLASVLRNRVAWYERAISSGNVNSGW
jgi:alpha-amylase/alpha-mannosidase (GH57 family)